jgi:hypothetical protein
LTADIGTLRALAPAPVAIKEAVDRIVDPVARARRCRRDDDLVIVDVFGERTVIVGGQRDLDTGRRAGVCPIKLGSVRNLDRRRV